MRPATLDPMQSRHAVKARVKARQKAGGAVIVEYAFLLVAVAIPTIMGMTAGGLAMLKDYQAARNQILQSTP